MPTYTSAINGNWNTDATWGGAGHPSANDDVVVIGHQVTYDAGDSAVTWGNVTVNNGGILIFPTSSDSTILFNATGTLTVNSGGELRAGTSGTPVDAANHCYFHWPQGAAARYVFVINDGATINIYGDSDFYGSERYADLDSNWTAGQTLYITGNFSSKWQAGQKFYIHENKLYSDYTSDGHIYTIDAVGTYDSTNNRTPVTIVEAAPGLTFTAVASGHTSELILISRNIHCADVGASLAINAHAAYTERIRTDNNQAVGNNKINIEDALFYGWDICIDGGYNFNSNNSIYINNNNALKNIFNSIVNCDLISNNQALATVSNIDMTGNIVSNSIAFYSIIDSKITGDIISNLRGFYTSKKVKIIGDIISNSQGLYLDNSFLVFGNFILNAQGIYFGNDIKIEGNFSGNTVDFNYPYSCLIKNSDFSSISQNTAINYKSVAIVYENCDIASVNREIRIYENAGTILPLVSTDGDWQAPDSENDWILQLTPNSYCSTSLNMQVILSPLRDIAVYANAGDHTITFKIYPNSWTTALDQDDIYIKAYYLASSDNARTEIQTSSETYANAGWRECTVSFTTGREGLVYFNLYFTAYEAGKWVLIDPQWIMKSRVNTLDVYSMFGVLHKFVPVLPSSNPSLEGKIYDSLSASAAVTTLVADRIYPQMRPQNESRPSIVYSRIGGDRDYALGEGYTDIENPRVSIEVYATAIDARRQTSTAVIAAMEASTRFSALCIMAPVDIYDPVTEEYKRITDFSIWNPDT